MSQTEPIGSVMPYRTCVNLGQTRLEGAMMMWLLVVLVVVVVALAFGVPNTSGTSPFSARHVLDERLAAGELTTEEHAARVALLAGRDGTRLPWVALAIGLGVLVILGTLWWGSDGYMGWGRWGDGDGMMGDSDGMMGDHMRGTSISGTADAPVAGAMEIEVVATEMRFDPATVTSTPGEAVNITLVNDGAVFHDLVIGELGFRLRAEPGEDVTASLTVDDPGTYAFACTVRGHAAAGMRGTVQVRGSNR